MVVESGNCVFGVKNLFSCKDSAIITLSSVGIYCFCNSLLSSELFKTYSSYSTKSCWTLLLSIFLSFFLLKILKISLNLFFLFFLPTRDSTKMGFSLITIESI